MKGTMLILRPGERRPMVIRFDRAPTLPELKAGIDGGYLELVPAFNTIAIGSTVMDCVAMCDEDGKRKELPMNDYANSLWHASAWRISRSREPLRDHLVGNVIVLFGDREFMESL
jgi:hypothetical protein